MHWISAYFNVILTRIVYLDYVFLSRKMDLGVKQKYVLYVKIYIFC